MEPWTGAQRAFAVKEFYKNGNSFMIAQREFGSELRIHHSCAVPSAHAIKTWVQNFKVTGSTLRKKGGSVKTVRKPKNIAVVREAIERSPHHSVRRHSVTLGLSEASVQ
jgi:transposase